MSNIRQTHHRPPRPGPLPQHLEDPSLLRTASVGFSSGYHWQLHGSAWGVVVWASRGAITVTIGSLIWIVPPHRALWVPPHVAHAVHMAGRGTLRQVYIASRACHRLSAVPMVVQVTPLLRELLRRVCEMGTLDAEEHAHARLFEVLRDELVAVRSGPLELPMPVDARALRAARYARHAPAASQQADRVAREANASIRTLERLFRAETGLSFGAWRHRARLLHAMTRLADGASVTEAGLSVGYANTSAFVAAFRRSIGVTPGRYAESTSASSALAARRA